MLRQVLLQLSKSARVRDIVERAPVTRGVVHRFVPGADVEAAVSASSDLVASGRLVTIDHLGEDVLDVSDARRTRDAYITALQRLSDVGLATDGRVEVSLKLSAVGQALDADGEKVALEHAWDICQAAQQAGTTVTLDMEDHTTTDSTLSVLRDLRADFGWVGAVVQAYLKRTEADCRDLASEGSRVRLCKGAYDEPEAVAFKARAQVDASYVRCMKVLMNGPGYPMLATHDPRMVDIGGALAVRAGRDQGTYEFQMLYGIRPDEQIRLAEAGEKMRVYLPYGDDWYGYFMRRLAERPANLAFFARSLATKG